MDWLGDAGLALSTMAAIDIWQQTCFVVLLLSAGSRRPAARSLRGGGGGWCTALQQFVYITLPMLRPVAGIAVIIQLTNEFRTYDLPYVLTRGGPGTSTEVLSFFAYRRAFVGLRLNEGAAAFFLLVIVLALTVVFFALLERAEPKARR